MQDKSRDTDIENGLVDTVGEEEGGTKRRVALTYIPHLVYDRELARSRCYNRGLSSALCDYLAGWGRELGRLKREEKSVYMWPFHIVVEQKLTQYCKVIIL